jgi:hypothetical protein
MCLRHVSGHAFKVKIFLTMTGNGLDISYFEVENRDAFKD